MDNKILKVLLVEDHLIVQKATCIMLNSIGFHVDKADCGSKALENFYKQAYNLILMDIGLPDMDGLTLAEIMRNSDDPRKSKTPIVVVTAHSDKAYRDRAEAIGVEEYITKPFTIEIRDRIIKKILNMENE